MLSRSGVSVMGGILTLCILGPLLVVRQVAVLMPLWVPDVVVGPWRVEKLQLVGLTPAFEHCLCAHMVCWCWVAEGMDQFCRRYSDIFRQGSKWHI